MSTINSLLESSASGWKNMQNDAARMASKWGKTGLLEGLGSEVNKNNMAMILENQAKQLVTEQSSTNAGGASFTTGQGEQWNRAGSRYRDHVAHEKYQVVKIEE